MISKEIDIFFRWLQIREDNGYGRNLTLSQLRADADHSSLLKRLLQGEEPLPEAPPRSFSYPWCRLILDGVGHPFEVYESELFPGMLGIDQSTWVILERPAENTWIVTYKTPDVARIRLAPAKDFDFARATGSDEYLKNSDSRWKVYSKGPDPHGGPSGQLWVIERVT